VQQEPVEQIDALVLLAVQRMPRLMGPILLSLSDSLGRIPRQCVFSFVAERRHVAPRRQPDPDLSAYIELAIDHKATAMSLHNFMRDIQSKTISQVSLRAVEGLKEVSQGLFVHSAALIPHDDLHHVAVCPGAEPNPSANGYGLNGVRYEVRDHLSKLPGCAEESDVLSTFKFNVDLAVSDLSGKELQHIFEQCPCGSIGSPLNALL